MMGMEYLREVLKRELTDELKEYIDTQIRCELQILRADIVEYNNQDEIAIDTVEMNIDDYEMEITLKECLDKLGKTQTWLCEQAKISRSTLAYILNKPQSASLLNIFKIATVLGVPIEHFIKFATNKDK